MAKVSFDQTDELRMMVTSVASMLGVDVQGMVLDEAGEELYDAALVMGKANALLLTLADIAANRGSTEAKLLLLKAQAEDFQEALTYVGDLAKDFPYEA